MPPESVRSRSGCLTCRNRKKKCDELFRADGSCERCWRGSHECLRGARIKGAIRPRPAIASAFIQEPNQLQPSAPSSSGGSSAGGDVSVASPSTFPSPAYPSPVAHFASPPTYHPSFSPSIHPLLANHQVTPELEMTPDLSQFFESLDAFAGPSESPIGLMADIRRPEDMAEDLRDAESWVSAATMLEMGRVGASTPEDSVEISPLYAAFNEGFFRSIPKPVREIMVKRMNNVASSSQLGAAASMAMVLLYRARTQPQGTEEAEQAQQRLLAQSDRFFQQAVLHLQTPIPLEGKIVACLDMQSHQFDLSGAAASHAVLLLSEFFITEALGPRPVLDLSNLADESNIALRCFAYSDVLRTVCIRRRATVFDFVGLPGFTSQPMPTQSKTSPANEAVDTHLGLPVGLLLCLAATSNLSCEASNLSSGVVQEKAKMIESAIRHWRPLAPNGVEDSLSYLERLVTYEMWRQACLIYLYQAVNRLGCLAQCIRGALEQFLSLAARDGPRPPVDSQDRLWAGSVRACPWLLAATCAVREEDREQCRQGLKECGPQKGYSDNLAAVEKLWEVVETGGWALDWKEFLETEKMFVAFL